MKTILQKKTFSLVLQLGTQSKEQPSLTASVVLSHCDLDDDGNICLSSSTNAHGILETIDSLKSELDVLANEIVSWLAHSVTLRRAQFSIISNDDYDFSGQQKAAEDSTHESIRR